jgi:hypothetical protein
MKKYSRFIFVLLCLCLFYCKAKDEVKTVEIDTPTNQNSENKKDNKEFESQETDNPVTPIENNPIQNDPIQEKLFTPKGLFTVVEYDWNIGIESAKEPQTVVINDNFPILLSDRKILQDGLIMLFTPRNSFDPAKGYGVRLQVKMEDSKDNSFIGYSIPDHYDRLITGIVMVYQKYIIITKDAIAQFAVYNFDPGKGISDYQNQTTLFPNKEFIGRNTREARFEPGTECYYVPIGIYGDFLFVHAYTSDNPIGLEIYNLPKGKSIYIGNWDKKRIEFLDQNSVVVYDFHGEITRPRDPDYNDQGYSATMHKYNFNLETEQKISMNSTVIIDF